jgi:hypothetical protein
MRVCMHICLHAWMYKGMSICLHVRMHARIEHTHLACLGRHAHPSVHRRGGSQSEHKHLSVAAHVPRRRGYSAWRECTEDDAVEAQRIGHDINAVFLLECATQGRGRYIPVLQSADEND